MVPRPPLARHATQDAAAMETVARVAAVGDGAAGEVALVADFGAKLGHSRVLAVGELKTFRTREREREREREIKKERVRWRIDRGEDICISCTKTLTDYLFQRNGHAKHSAGRVCVGVCEPHAACTSVSASATYKWYKRGVI